MIVSKIGKHVVKKASYIEVWAYGDFLITKIEPGDERRADQCLGK